MGKWIRRIIVIIVVLAVVLEGVLQIYVGIERKKRAEAPGNAEKYDAANLEKNSGSGRPAANGAIYRSPKSIAWKSRRRIIP